jgi:hypothetical protein
MNAAVATVESSVTPAAGIPSLHHGRDQLAQSSSSSSSAFSSTSGFKSLQVHYRTSSIPYRVQLHDLYIVPALSEGGNVASMPNTVSATLTSPLLRGAVFSPKEPFPAATSLKYELHDLHCPNCAGSHPVSKHAQSSSSHAAAGGGGGDAGGLRGRSSSPSPQRQEGAVAGGSGEPATMQRCAQCILCPMCRSAVAHRRAYPDKQLPSTPTAATALVDSGAAVIYCNACHWRTPSLPPQSLRTWMASCTHAVVRSACGYQPIVSALKHSAAPVSMSSAARSSVTRDVSDGTIPFTTIRSEKVLQLDAALEKETSQLHSENGNLFWSAAQQFGSQRLVGQQVVQRTADDLLQSHDVVLPPPQRKRDGTASGAASRDPTGLVAKEFGGLVSQSPAALPVMFYSLDGGAVGATSASPQSVSVAGAFRAPGEDAAVEQEQQELRVIPMLRAPLMPRCNVVVAGGSDANVGALVSALSSSCHNADGVSGKQFTNALTNAQLSTSLCATRYLPVVLFPANMSRYAKTDAATPLSSCPPCCVSGGSEEDKNVFGRRLFVMLRLLNAEELTSVTVHSITIVSVEGCTASLSIPLLRTTDRIAEGEKHGGAEGGDGRAFRPLIVLRHKFESSSSSSSSSPPASVAGVRYYVDSRISDDIFPQPDSSTCDAAGVHMRQGSCIFGINVCGGTTSTDAPDASATGACCIELEITVTVVSAVLHSALRRAYPIPANGADGVTVTYRSLITLES